MDLPGVRLEDTLRRFGRGAEQRALLLLAPPPEAVRGGAALLVAALDEAGADLGRDEPLAFEDANGVAAETHEQRGDDAVFGQRLEQRLELDLLVHARVGEAERRAHGDRLLRRLRSRPALPLRPAARPARKRAPP